MVENAVYARFGIGELNWFCDFEVEGGSCAIEMGFVGGGEED